MSLNAHFLEWNGSDKQSVAAKESKAWQRNSLVSYLPRAARRSRRLQKAEGIWAKRRSSAWKWHTFIITSLQPERKPPYQLGSYLYLLLSFSPLTPSLKHVIIKNTNKIQFRPEDSFLLLFCFFILQKRASRISNILWLVMRTWREHFTVCGKHKFLI